MIGYLVVIAVLAAIVWDQTGKRSGRVWAYVTTFSLAVIATSLLISSVLLFLRQPYAPLPDDLGQYRGRGALIVVGLWAFFHSLGPKGTGLLLCGIGLGSARLFRDQLALMLSGVYVGLDEQEKLRAQYLGLIAKTKALAEANVADGKWVEAAKAKAFATTFNTHEEGERAAAAINAMVARRSARWQEIQTILAQARALEPTLGIKSSAVKDADAAA